MSSSRAKASRATGKAAANPIHAPGDSAGTDKAGLRSRGTDFPESRSPQKPAPEFTVQSGRHGQAASTPPRAGFPARLQSQRRPQLQIRPQPVNQSTGPTRQPQLRQSVAQPIQPIQPYSVIARATKVIAANARVDCANEIKDLKKPPQSTPPRLSSTGLDSQAIRKRMVERLAAQGVADPAVLAAMGQIERHRFVDSALSNQAYEDTSLPIGLGQTISKPNVVARMLELLRAGHTGKLGRVLEIGTGCGYQAAVLSHLAREVYSIERLRGLHKKAIDNLRHLRLPNVHLLYGDGMLGYPKGAPYAAIIAAAGGEAIPAAWIDQLAVGGRLVAPLVTVGGAQALVVIEKTPQGVTRQLLEAVHFVPLKSGLS